MIPRYRSAKIFCRRLFLIPIERTRECESCGSTGKPLYTLDGMVAVFVNETLSAGTEKFRSDLQRTHEAFDLSTFEDGNILRYGGVTIDQSSPTITVCQNDCIKTITKLPVKGVNMSDIRSGRGRPSWVTTWTSPDHARAIANISQATENTISNATIKQLNEVIAGLQAKPDHMLRYVPMQLGQSKLVAFSDASFACNDDLSSKIAGIVLLKAKKIVQKVSS
jgi:hypothetical protein